MPLSSPSSTASKSISKEAIAKAVDKLLKYYSSCIEQIDAVKLPNDGPAIKLTGSDHKLIKQLLKNDASHQCPPFSSDDFADAQTVRVAYSKHIERLHTYNDVKDAVQSMLGRLAVFKGATTAQMYAEYGIDKNS